MVKHGKSMVKVR